MNLLCLRNNTILNATPGRRYTILGMLGSGGFGITYLALMEENVGGIVNRRRVALKEHFVKTMCGRKADGMTVDVFPNLAESYRRSLKDFIGEATRLRTVTNRPNIVRLNEVFQLNGTAYYAMEYIEGSTLSDLIARQGPMDELHMRRLMDQIIGAVAELHRARITHLDIKPANIMIDASTNRPVLIDFGLSKHYHDDGSPTSTINTQGVSDGYAPVEQYGGVSTFSPTCDVYALAATMYFCLTGSRLPRAGEIQPGDISRMLPAHISPKLRNAMTKALAYAAADRTPDGASLLNSLYAPQDTLRVIPEEETVKVMPTIVLSEEKPEQKQKKHYGWYIIFSIILAIAAGGANWYFLTPRNSVQKSEAKEVSAKKSDVKEDSAAQKGYRTDTAAKSLRMPVAPPPVVKTEPVKPVKKKEPVKPKVKAKNAKQKEKEGKKPEASKKEELSGTGNSGKIEKPHTKPKPEQKPSVKPFDPGQSHTLEPPR